MGFKEKLEKYYQDTAMKRYGDRLTQVKGNVLSVKIEEKKILWIFYKIKAVLIVRPERSKGVVTCVYKRNRWFKKPTFMSVSQGNLVIIQGLKAKKKKSKDAVSDGIEIANVINITTKKELHHVDGDIMKKATKVQYKYK